MANRDKQAKEDKKTPQHTAKEKRQLKRDKKAAKQAGLTPD